MGLASCMYEVYKGKASYYVICMRRSTDLANERPSVSNRMSYLIGFAYIELLDNQKKRTGQGSSKSGEFMRSGSVPGPGPGSLSIMLVYQMPSEFRSNHL